MQNKEEDRISSLPDHLLHLIISYLPTTKEAIRRTSILSKTWQNLYKHYPSLIFEFYNGGTEIIPTILNSIEQNSCTQIDKFVLEAQIYESDSYGDDEFQFHKSEVRSQFNSCLLMALKKQPKFVSLYIDYLWSFFPLPEFFYNNCSVIDMKLIHCDFVSNEYVDWKVLKVLRLVGCKLSNEMVENVISGSPFLESLELRGCYGFHRIVSDSKCLKKLVFSAYNGRTEGGFSTPVIVSSRYLEKLELVRALEMEGNGIFNLPSLISATLDFQPTSFEYLGSYYSVIFYVYFKALLQQFHCVEELKVAGWCIQLLSTMEMNGLTSPLLNSKCLTLSIPWFAADLHGAAILLRSLPKLERLRLEVDSANSYKFAGDRDLSKSVLQTYWMSYKMTSNPLLHLKTIEVFCLDKNNRQYEVVLELVEFLLKNAVALESITISMRACGRYFADTVSRRLSTMPRASPHSIVIFSK